MRSIVLLSMLLTACGATHMPPERVCHLERPTTTCADLVDQKAGYGMCVKGANGEAVCECTAPHTKQPNGRCG